MVTLQAALALPPARKAFRPRFIGSMGLLMAATVALVGCSHSVSPEALREFQEAQRVFDQADTAEDFLVAAGLYQQILDRGIVSGAVLYNQGNAFMRAGRRGEAIAAYRQAKRYRPRDPYLEANLQYALGSPSASPVRRPVLDTLIFWQDWISYPATLRLMAIFGGATFAVAATWLVLRRRWLAWSAATGMALTLVAALSAGYDWYRYEAISYGVVTASETIARKGNAASYEPAFTEALREGAEFRLVDRRGEWLLIRMPGAQQAWVEAKDVIVY